MRKTHSTETLPSFRELSFYGRSSDLQLYPNCRAFSPSQWHYAVSTAAHSGGSVQDSNLFPYSPLPRHRKTYFIIEDYTKNKKSCQPKSTNFSQSLTKKQPRNLFGAAFAVLSFVRSTVNINDLFFCCLSRIREAAGIGFGMICHNREVLRFDTQFL